MTAGRGHGRASGVALAGFLASVLILAGSPVGAATAWAPTLPMRPQTQQHLDLFRDGTAYAYSAQDNIVYASSDFGRTWTPRTSAPGPYAAVAFGTAKTGYAATFGGEVVKTNDGAETWAPQRGPLGQLGGVYHSIEVAAKGRVVVIGGQEWVEGCRPPKEGSVSIWYSGDAGATWREKQLPFFGSVRSIDMLDARTGIAIIYDRYRLSDESEDCIYESASNGVWLTRDGFRTMDKIYDCSGNEICSAATMASASRILVGTNNGDLYLSVNGGRRFSAVGRFAGPYDAVGEPFFWIGALGFASPKVGYMSTKGGGTWRTTDGGKTWMEEYSPEGVWGVGVGDLAVADVDHAIAGGPNFVITRVESGD